MQLVIKRIAKKPNYTIGKLYIDGKYFCDTLEDTDRGLDDSQTYNEIMNKKIKSKTAIPTGEYIVMSTLSPRFKRNLPLVMNVKGFEGIRIHSGNISEHTEGCILVGKNRVIGKVVDSRKTLELLLQKLDSTFKLEII